MNKRIIIITVFFLFLFSSITNAQNFEYHNENTNYSILIEDDALLLSESEMDKLASDMIPLTEYGHIVFKSINENNTSTEKYARDFYHNQYGSYSGSLFLIDMYNRMIYIFSDGNNYNVIYNSKAEIITDNVYKYATNQRYYDCASNAFKQMNTLLAGGKIVEPMRYASNILIAIVSGFLISFVYIVINSRIRSAKLNDILKNCNISFNVDNIVAIKTGEHRVYSPQSSSSGSYSSGGGRRWRSLIRWWWRA